MFKHTSSPPQLPYNSAHPHPELLYNPYRSNSSYGKWISIMTYLTSNSSRYRSSGFSYAGRFFDPKNRTLGFTGSESPTLKPTNELDKNQGTLSTDGAEDEMDYWPIMLYAFSL